MLKVTFNNSSIETRIIYYDTNPSQSAIDIPCLPAGRRNPQFLRISTDTTSS